MANVKKSATNSSKAFQSMGKSSAMAACESIKQDKNARTPTKRQQQALNNFLYGQNKGPLPTR